MEEFDYIVVGGGTSGCILASRLSEDPSARVLLLEAGGQDRSRLLGIPGALARVAFHPLYNWGYTTEPQAALNGRRIPLIQARILGGGSSINGMVYSRGAARDFDAWAHDMGCDGWSYDNVLPYFRRTERSERGAGPYHGADGPVSVVRARSPLPIIEHARQAFREAGYPALDDLGVPNPDGVGFYDWTIARGRRASIPASYPGLRGGRPNLVVRSGVQVRRLLFRSGRATGVEIGAERAVQTIQAAREVVLCAGGINTPRLLMLSGIGPADMLRALGIDVVIDQPELGQNLQNHTAHRLTFSVTKPITVYRYLRPIPGALELARYAFGRTGFLSCGAAPFGGFFRSDPDLPAPDSQVFVSPVLFGTRPGPFGMLPNAHGLSIGINQGVPSSRGSITLRSADPAAAPVIDPRYFSDPRDMAVLVNATQRIREVARAPALASVIGTELSPGPAIDTAVALEADIRAVAGNHYHVCGTCRMGSDDRAVVDTRLRLRGIENVRLGDFSVAPRLINGNTSAAVMMIAERASDFLCEDA